MKTLTIQLDDLTLKNLEYLASLKKATIAELIHSFVEQELDVTTNDCKLCQKYGKKPNRETINALNDSVKGYGNSPHFDSVDDLFAHLDKEDD